MVPDTALKRAESNLRSRRGMSARRTSAASVPTVVDADAGRVLTVYGRRSIDDVRYSALDPAAWMATSQRQEILLGALRSRGLTSLQSLDVLDVGCGAGGELARLIGLGADPERLHGIDLRSSAIEVARRRLPSSELVTGNAAALPWPTSTFDLVTQYTVFSSILDATVRRAVAAEMVRVVRPDGLLVLYDFWINPWNRDTIGITPFELRRLFPGHRIRIRTATLAPPISRAVARRSRHLASLLQALPGLRTHLVAIVDRPG